VSSSSLRSHDVPRAGTAGRGVCTCTAFVLGFLLLSAPAWPAQQAQSTYPSSGSTLVEQNLKRVAAPAAEIEQVLRRDPGLLVELKRWVAKDASEHGQIVEDADLTDQGIYDRLGRELEFRSVATRLLQRYGYLVPKPNPGSEAALEQQFLLQAKQQQLQKSLAEQERVQSATEGEPRGGTRGKEPPRRGGAAAPAEISPTPGAPALPETLPELRSLPLMRASASSGQGIASGDTGASALPRYDDGRAAMSAELRERGAVSAAPPEAAPVSRPSGGTTSARAGEKRESAATPDRPAMVRRPNPYATIPSYYDLYKQVSAYPPDLRRFGMDVFENTSSEATSQLPMDLPVGPEYVVGPGDGLAIDLWGAVSQRLYRLVDREGRLSLPEVGPILVSGRSLGDVQQQVQQALRTQFHEVSADVSLSRLRTVRVYVVGDVANPGAYDISSLSTPLNALFAAGGPTENGSLRMVRHYRGKQLVEEVDLYDLLLHGIRSDMKRLENGDTVQVPPLGPQITFAGMVRRPAVYEMRNEKTLAEGLELAGGILPAATLRHIDVQRVEAHQKRTMLSLDIDSAGSSEEVNRQLQAFAVRGNDEVRIFPIAPYNLDAVFLQGHVLRPGQYTYHAGMKLTDLIGSYGELLPEPAAKYAEIVRLNPPDYRPSVESFELAAAMANPTAAPKLQPLDTVRIFSRYDFEAPPAVTVGGEVQVPGTYRTPGLAHVRDAVYLAGGATPDALLEGAQLIRTMPDGSLKVLSINLQQALAGDPIENVLLQPRDRLLIQRKTATVDPASVYVKGEVAQPGRYPLTTNLRIEDVIRMSGGMKRSAYTEQADLTRFDPRDTVKQLGEHVEIDIAAALAGDPNNDIPLRDGDVLTIRQLPGWSDIGASVSLGGELTHPGAYGIAPGEKLSSVLKRADGFRSTAYPQGAILLRLGVRELQEKSRQELINRVQQEVTTAKVSLNETSKDQAELQQAALQQRERVLASLRDAPITGRLVIHLTTDLSKLENTPDDIELRVGDSLYVPKRPQYVAVTGQVYNSNALTFQPNRTMDWYLKRAGGVTNLADKKDIFVIRASGEVVSGNAEGWWTGKIGAIRIFPGDTIVVPEKPIGTSTFWKNFVAIAQIAQAAAVTAFIATK
jgi:protein involved in polysaccharide export with SLBB domain